MAKDAKEVNTLLWEAPLPLIDGPNILRWKLRKRGTYSMKSSYLAMLEEHPNDFPVKKIWMKGVTHKVTHFLWLVYRKRIATIDNLRKRGQILVNRCSLYYKVEETMDHLCQFCSFT